MVSFFPEKVVINLSIKESLLNTNTQTETDLIVKHLRPSGPQGPHISLAFSSIDQMNMFRDSMSGLSKEDQSRGEVILKVATTLGISRIE